MLVNDVVPVGAESKLLKARMRMQQKYIDQFYMLYDDFHMTKLPLLPEEVIGLPNNMKLHRLWGKICRMVSFLKKNLYNPILL